MCKIIRIDLIIKVLLWPYEYKLTRANLDNAIARRYGYKLPKDEYDKLLIKYKID